MTLLKVLNLQEISNPLKTPFSKVFFCCKNYKNVQKNKIFIAKNKKS